jgi:hypothetical protein
MTKMVQYRARYMNTYVRVCVPLKCKELYVL